MVVQLFSTLSLSTVNLGGTASLPLHIFAATNRPEACSVIARGFLQRAQHLQVYPLRSPLLNIFAEQEFPANPGSTVVPVRQLALTLNPTSTNERPSPPPRREWLCIFNTSATTR